KGLKSASAPGSNDASNGDHPSPERQREVAHLPSSEKDLKIEYVRHITGTLNDVRGWNHKNLQCINCRGTCPICDSPCCLREDARRKVSNENTDPQDFQQAKKILKIIDFLGAYAKEASTFSLCSQPGGCGRHVCRSCCGVCPNEICRDIQCKVEAGQPVKGRRDHVKHFSEAPHRTTSQLCQSREQHAAEETESTQPPNAYRQPGCASHTFKMRTYDDSFSGQKIYPGKGKLYVRGDSKIFRFQNGKSESLFLQRKNPRRIAWTVLYRRQHKKGISEEVAKKRTRRVVKHQRAIVGASLDVIKERRSMRPEARAAARQQAIKEAKEKKAATESRKKAEKAKNAAAAGKGAAQRIQSKQGAKGSAPKVAAKSR
ncbi:hypothetical protein AOCH_007164, partial [Aspergillus ochraceoroseus]